MAPLRIAFGHPLKNGLVQREFYHISCNWTRKGEMIIIKREKPSRR
jgi:hypothetical protein